MVVAPGVSLAKITVQAPRRWIDVALPADVAVAELLPYILRHGGEDAADAGERHAGWLLRRPTGESLDTQKTLGAQQVRDGELLHLVPGEVEWPELEYEDLVETIASGARRYGRSWGKAATRRCGLALCAALLLAGTLVALLFEPPWRGPGLTLLTAAAVLLAVGVVVARALPDARAGVVFAGCSLPYAFLGGLLVTAPDHFAGVGARTGAGAGSGAGAGLAGLAELGAPQLQLAATALLVFAIAGLVGVTALVRVFAAAIAIGLLGMLGALVGGPLGADGAAALVLVTGIGLLPGYPLLALRLGRLPLPSLPQRSADLLSDEKPPPAPEVFVAAARTDELLTGLLTGLAVVSVLAAALLTASGGVSHQLLLTAVGLALLLRARLFPIPRQRLPLLAAGVLAMAMLLGLRIVTVGGNGALALMLLAVIGTALLVAAAGLVYSRKHPSPQLGRLGDIFDVLAILALIPLTGYIAGLFHYVQSLLGGIG